MMRQYYPVMIDLNGKKIVVIGGGAVATRKIGGLLMSGAEITVISPSVTDQIKQWAYENYIKWLPSKFEGKHNIQDAFLVFAATNNVKVNREISQMASSFQLLNIVDHPQLSNFIVPSTFTRGKLSVSVSTSGSYPGLSKKIKQELLQIYDESYEEYVGFLEQCRAEILKNISDPQTRSRIFEKLLDPIFLELTKKGNYQERNNLFLSMILQ